jgi:hypothetical protein
MCYRARPPATSTARIIFVFRGVHYEFRRRDDRAAPVKFSRHRPCHANERVMTCNTAQSGMKNGNCCVPARK